MTIPDPLNSILAHFNFNVASHWLESQSPTIQKECQNIAVKKYRFKREWCLLLLTRLWKAQFILTSIRQKRWYKSLVYLITNNADSTVKIMQNIIYSYNLSYLYFSYCNIPATIKLWMYPDSKVHGANMGPTWVLSAPNGPHVGLMNLAIRVIIYRYPCITHSILGIPGGP